MNTTGNALTLESLESWWSPAGWDRRLVPAAFVQVWNAVDEDWDTSLREADYESVRSAQEFITGSCDIYRHVPSGHLFVSWAGPERFFVAKADTVAFWVDKYPSLIQAECLERQAEAAEQLARAMLGFVRHGHGVDVIDEIGTTSKEQREFEAQRFRVRKAGGG